MWKGPGCSQTGNSVRNFSSGQGWPAGFINKDGCLHRSKTETEEEEVEVGESISNLLIYSRLLETQGVNFFASQLHGHRSDFGCLQFFFFFRGLTNKNSLMLSTDNLNCDPGKYYPEQNFSHRRCFWSSFKVPLMTKS